MRLSPDGRRGWQPLRERHKWMQSFNCLTRWLVNKKFDEVLVMFFLPPICTTPSELRACSIEHFAVQPQQVLCNICMYTAHIWSGLHCPRTVEAHSIYSTSSFTERQRCRWVIFWRPMEKHGIEGFTIHKRRVLIFCSPALLGSQLLQNKLYGALLWFHLVVTLSTTTAHYSPGLLRWDRAVSLYELWDILLNLIRAHFTASQIKLAAC